MTPYWLIKLLSDTTLTCRQKHLSVGLSLAIFRLLTWRREMNVIELWQRLFGLSSGNTWIRIPDDIRRGLSLPATLGICGGILCTKRAAMGSQQFIQKLNAIGGVK